MKYSELNFEEKLIWEDANEIHLPLNENEISFIKKISGNKLWLYYSKSSIMKRRANGLKNNKRNYVLKSDFLDEEKYSVSIKLDEDRNVYIGKSSTLDNEYYIIYYNRNEKEQYRQFLCREFDSLIALLKDINVCGKNVN